MEAVAVTLRRMGRVGQELAAPPRCPGLAILCLYVNDGQICVPPATQMLE